MCEGMLVSLKPPKEYYTNQVKEVCGKVARVSKVYVRGVFSVDDCEALWNKDDVDWAMTNFINGGVVC